MQVTWFWNSLCTIGKEDLDVSAVEAMLSQHVVHIPQVVTVVQTGAPSIPAAREQHRLVAYFENPTGSAHQVVACLAAFGVVQDGVTYESRGLIQCSQGGTRAKAREVGAAGESLGLTLVIFQEDFGDEVYFTPTREVAASLSALQRVLAASLERKDQTFTALCRQNTTSSKYEFSSTI